MAAVSVAFAADSFATDDSLFATSAYVAFPVDEPPDELRRLCWWLPLLFISDKDSVPLGLFYPFSLGLTIFLPVWSHFMLCDNDLRQWSDVLVQVLLSVTGLTSYAVLQEFSWDGELHEFMTLKRLCTESERVRNGYRDVLNWFFILMCIIVIPCFAMELAYKLWWCPRCPEHEIKISNEHLILLRAFELLSWFHRSANFVFLYLFYCALCKLELLRLEEFGTFFQHNDGEEGLDKVILTHHLRVRHHIDTISRQFCPLLVLCRLIAILFPVVMFYLATHHFSHVSIVDTIELGLCLFTIMIGVNMSLYYSGKVTRRARMIAIEAANWHACSTFTYLVPMDSDQTNPCLDQVFESHIEPSKRREIVSYLHNNKAGITIFGRLCCDSWFIVLFSLELIIVCWFLLGDTLKFSEALRYIMRVILENANLAK